MAIPVIGYLQDLESTTPPVPVDKTSSLAHCVGVLRGVCLLAWPGAPRLPPPTANSKFLENRIDDHSVTLSIYKYYIYYVHKCMYVLCICLYTYIHMRCIFIWTKAYSDKYICILNEVPGKVPNRGVSSVPVSLHLSSPRQPLASVPMEAEQRCFTTASTQSAPQWIQRCSAAYTRSSQCSSLVSPAGAARGDAGGPGVVCAPHQRLRRRHCTALAHGAINKLKVNIIQTWLCFKV